MASKRIEVAKRRLQGDAERLVRQGKIATVAVILLPGGERLEVAAGHVDLARTIAVTPIHLHQAGSQTKSFIAAAILLLAREGKLDLASPIAHHFPSISDYADGALVTFDHLLSHTSGIGNFTESLEGTLPAGAFPWPFPQLDFDDLMALTRAHGKQFEPGAKFEYNNSAFVILGRIVEDVSGQPIQDFLRQRVLEPLAMTDTFFAAVEDWPAERMAKGYYTPPTGCPDPPVDMTAHNMTWASTAGDTVTTCDDLLKWVNVLIDADNPLGLTFADFTGHRVECWQPEPTWLFPETWGRGVADWGYAGREAWGHLGGTFGYLSGTVADPESGVRMSAFVTFEGEATEENQLLHSVSFYAGFLPTTFQLALDLVEL